MRQPRGQSLIETMVALAIIVTGLVGAITLATMSVRATSSSDNRLIALNLSWEAIEVAQAIRDSNFLAGAAFDTGLNGGGDTTAIASFDPAANTWTFDFGPNSLSDNATKFYQQGGLYRQATATLPGIATNFRRLITFTNATDQVQVVSTVQWMEGTNLQSVSVERIFYNWR